MRFNKYCVVAFLLFAGPFASCSATRQAVSAGSAAKPVLITPVKTDTLPPVKDSSKTDAFLEGLLKQYPQYFDFILSNRKALNVQFIYTKVDRGANGIAALKQYYFNVNPKAYFYPASTVKFPISLLALQKLNELKGDGIDKNTTMITENGYGSQTAVFNDPTTIDGKPSIAQYIKKILMVSDNDAHNRLYEFLGQQYINDQLQQKGYTDAQLIHRLHIFLPEEENRHTNPVKFLAPDNKVLYQQPMQYNTTKFPDRNDVLGKAYYKGDSLINTPMNFSLKNRISLEDLHTMLISLVFPNKVTAAQRFNITDEDRKFLLKYMSQLPAESTYPPYSSDTNTYYPAYCKFLLFGAEKGTLPSTVRSFNKVGDAYGQLLDVAYIVDFDKKIEFFLSAVIYCNSDGILNDDKYDYESIGYPFMKHLGQVIYDYEVKRERKIEPDLGELKFIYDKK
jgi:beta-lactamase class A